MPKKAALPVLDLTKIHWLHIVIALIAGSHLNIGLDPILEVVFPESLFASVYVGAFTRGFVGGILTSAIMLSALGVFQIKKWSNLVKSLVILGFLVFPLLLR